MDPRRRVGTAPQEYILHRIRITRNWVRLFGMNASMKEHMQEMTARMDANHVEMKAGRNSDREQMLARMDAHTEEMKANTKAIQERTDTDRKNNGEDLKGMMEKSMNGSLAEMRSNICALRSESIQREMRAVIQPTRSELDETTACNEATETEPHLGIVQSVVEHHENPTEDAALMPVGGPRKRRRTLNVAAKSHQKLKERTQGYCGSRRKLAAACRKMSRRAKVAWRKRNLQENSDRGKD
jgi:hypothetical protein